MEKLQLEYFISVASSLNISASAKELYISQSSLSQTIMRLEQELGYDLFGRNGRHITLNENGKIFYEAVKDMKDIYETACEKIAEQNHIVNHKISINMKCASHFLPSMLVFLKDRMVDCNFYVTQQNQKTLEDDTADLTIYSSSFKEERKNAILLVEEEIVLAIPIGHHLAKKKDLTSVDLKDEDFMGLNCSWKLEQEILEQFGHSAFSPKMTIEVDNPDILRRLINKKLGLAFVPEQSWRGSFSKNDVTLRKIEDIPMKRFIYVAAKNGHLRNNVLQCMNYICDFFHNECH